MGFSIAGSETTATTLSAVTYFLLKHPDAYERFVNEIRNNFQSYHEISSAKVGRLEYFHAVIKEAMRLYPPVPFGPPRLSPGATVDKWHVPKGVSTVPCCNDAILSSYKKRSDTQIKTEVSVHPWTISRDARYFHDPDAFDPTRWLGENVKDDVAAFQPFHLGPRVCLGRK